MWSKCNITGGMRSFSNGSIENIIRSRMNREEKTDMDLKCFDNQCVRITTVSGEIYEGIVSYCSKEYVFHEYGQEEEALLLVPILLYKADIADIVSLENAEGPYGHFSEKYGLLEMKCIRWGTDLIEEVFETEDDEQILRMLACMKDHFPSLMDRAVSGPAPWRSAGGDGRTGECAKDGRDREAGAEGPEKDGKDREVVVEDSENDGKCDEDEQGPVYLGELENMLMTLVKYNGNEEVVREAKEFQGRLAAELAPDESGAAKPQ